MKLLKLINRCMRISGRTTDPKKPRSVNYNKYKDTPPPQELKRPKVEDIVAPPPAVVEVPIPRSIPAIRKVIPSQPITRPVIKSKDRLSEIRKKHKNTDTQYKEYALRYVLVDSRSIINMCGPEYNYKPQDWSDKKELRKRMEVGQKYIHLMNKTIGFYDRLEASILKDGFKNPILLTSGAPRFRSMEEIPPVIDVKIPEMLLCEIIGGSRLLIAQKHGFLIPAIVNDFTGMFPEGRLLKTEEDVAGCFENVPAEIIITNRGLRISPPLHTHLDKAYQEPQKVMAARRQVLRGNHAI